MEEQKMKEIDVRGLSCPIPVVKTKKAMDTDPEETLVILLETEVSKENVSRLATGRSYTIKEEKVSGDYRLTLTPPAA
jgi:tRNA 2-thiouridine synthesizing protein A